jgi:hypothetical protein
MARKRRTTRRKTSRRGNARIWIAAAGLALVAVIAVGFSYMDPVARWLAPESHQATRVIRAPTEQPPRPAAQKHNTAAGLPARMQAPSAKPAKPAERRRLAAAEPPRPQKAVTGAIAPAGGFVLPRPGRDVGSVKAGEPTAPTRGTPAKAAAVLLKPARKPQSGDCACPYDLMLDGSACGPRSSYLTPGREKPLCYR